MNKSREKQVFPIPYGLQPGQARQDHPVLAPEARNRAGRRKGSVNKYTATLRELILRAAEEVGDSQEVGKDGNGGALAYFKVSAIKEPKTFRLVMARILSTKIHSEVRQVKEKMSLTEAVAELRACGLDERLAFYLKRYPVERDEEDSAFADLKVQTISPVTPGLQPGQSHPKAEGSGYGHGGARAGARRRKGIPNKVTTTFRDLLMQPAAEVGDSKELGRDGQGGVLGYLKVSAVEERKTFLLLMARILPLKISTEVKEVKETMTIYEAIADLKACGMDELLAFYLKCYPV